MCFNNLPRRETEKKEVAHVETKGETARNKDLAEPGKMVLVHAYDQKHHTQRMHDTHHPIHYHIQNTRVEHKI
jgi:hypothetical protein